jgi:hypothetical protein
MNDSTCAPSSGAVLDRMSVAGRPGRMGPVRSLERGTRARIGVARRLGQYEGASRVPTARGVEGSYSWSGRPEYIASLEDCARRVVRAWTCGSTASWFPVVDRV